MLRIKNLTNSPYDIVDAEGKKVHLPARGEIETSVHAMHLPLYRSIGYFQITETGEKPADPLDHDGDGEKGGSLSVDGDKDVMSKLRADYQEIVGKRAFPGWDAAELQKRIDAALAS